MSNPPWAMGPMDRVLWAIRHGIPSAEFRHESLASFSKVMSIVAPWKAPAAAAVHLTFADGSAPLSLRTPLVLAAGANKNAAFLDAFASAGFGAVVVGTATLRPRSGNPLKPRARTLEDRFAIQNAMGLNNPGVKVLARRMESAREGCEKSGLVLGLSISEDPALLEGEDGHDNVLACLEEALPAAQFLELNLSCPNTGHDRLDQAWDKVERLLGRVSERREKERTKPALWVKLSPDLSSEALESAVGVVKRSGLTGVTLFNTWPAAAGHWPDGSSLPPLPEVGRPGLRGGLSGRPLYENTLEGVKKVAALDSGLSIQAVGGVETGSQIAQLRGAGADLVQAYSVVAFRFLAGRRMIEELAG